MPEATTFTSDEVMSAIAKAIGAKDLGAAVALIRRLALVDPGRARKVLDIITGEIAEHEREVNA